MKRLLTTSPARGNWRYALRGVAPLFMVVLLAACLKAPPPDPQLALTLNTQAEDRFTSRDYAGAAALMAEAVAAEPANLQRRLRHGELLEFADRPDQALTIYAGISAEGDIGTHHLRDEAAYRAALLFLLKLDRPDAARPFLDRLPNKSPRRSDGEAVLIMVNGDPRRALTLFNELGQQPLEQFVGARVAFHAALAFGRLNALPEAYSALYQAINLAERSIIARDIEIYRDELKQRDAGR